MVRGSSLLTAFWPVLVLVCGAFLFTDAGAEEADLPQPRPVPQLQVLPEPYRQFSFQRAGRELTRYHCGPDLRRPFLYPVHGPSGRSLTRMGSPSDVQGHGHHSSIWIAHHDVGGVNFWSNSGEGRIVHRSVLRLVDTATSAICETLNDWVVGGRVLLKERRRMEVEALDGEEWFLTLDLHLEAREEKVIFGKIPFGLVGVRMAKTIGVDDGGGRIRNSEGGLNEAGVLWKSARWVDYSGPVLRDVIEGITLMDHPKNPNHPTFFHVRDDGWMGASLTFKEPRTLRRSVPLHLRYGFYIHAGSPSVEDLDQRWKQFAARPLKAFEKER